VPDTQAEVEKLRDMVCVEVREIVSVLLCVSDTTLDRDNEGVPETEGEAVVLGECELEAEEQRVTV
jgi:hypothetical protein